MRTIDDHAVYWRARAEQSGEFCYLALGDSLTQGYGASAPDRGYVGQLVELVAQRTRAPVRVVNRSVCGATVRELVDEQLPQLHELKPDLVTVCIGANDAAATPTEQFRKAFSTVCEALPAGAFVTDIPDFQGGHAGEQARELAAVCRELVGAHPGLVPVAVEAATTGMAFNEFSDGFAHPDDSGYRRYTSAFWAAIEPTLREQLGGRSSTPTR